MLSRTDSLLFFVKEIEKLKHIERIIWTPDHARQENDAEHSWHVAMLLLSFEKELPEGFDLLRAIKMALIHDLVEIHAGDVFAFDTARQEGKHEREVEAARRLFAALPPDLEQEFVELFLEFERCDTQESRYTKSADRLQALLSNVQSGCYALNKNAISYERLRAYMDPPLSQTPAFSELYERLLAEAQPMLTSGR